MIAGTCEQVQSVCLNGELTISCKTDALVHQWTGTALSCPTDSVTVTFTDTVGDVFQCGNASIEVLEGGSRLNVTADSSLDGATVVCTDVDGILVDVDINVIGKQKKVYVIILHSKGSVHCRARLAHLCEDKRQTDFSSFSYQCV